MALFSCFCIWSGEFITHVKKNIPKPQYFHHRARLWEWKSCSCSSLAAVSWSLSCDHLLFLQCQTFCTCSFLSTSHQAACCLACLLQIQHAVCSLYAQQVEVRSVCIWPLIAERHNSAWHLISTNIIQTEFYFCWNALCCFWTFFADILSLNIKWSPCKQIEVIFLHFNHSTVCCCVPGTMGKRRVPTWWSWISPCSQDSSPTSSLWRMWVKQRLPPEPRC